MNQVRFRDVCALAIVLLEHSWSAAAAHDKALGGRRRSGGLFTVSWFQGCRAHAIRLPPQGLNMAVNAYLKYALGSSYSAPLLGVSEMPKPGTKLTLDFASLLGECRPASPCCMRH